MLTVLVIVAFVLMLLAPCVLALVGARRSRAASRVSALPASEVAGPNAHRALAARAEEARSIANRAAAQLREAIAAANSVHGDSVSLSNQVFAARSRAQLAERLAVAAEAAASIAASRAAIGLADAANARAEQAGQLARQTANELHSVRTARSRPSSTAA